MVKWIKQNVEQTGEATEQVAANTILFLIGITCSFLDRQIAAQAEAFQREGGFTERMYRLRKDRTGR